MPTYSYQCSKCEHDFEKILRIDDRKVPTEEQCPQCHAEHTVSLCLVAPSLMNPLRVDGLVKPPSQFRERMQQIKGNLRTSRHTLKDHY